MKLTKHLLILVLIIAGAFSKQAYAQVTIGSETPPIAGALLDLKNQADGSSTRGLALPRVQLTSLSKLYPMFKSAAESDVAAASHTGLLIYNIADDPVCPTFAGGIYVWDGNNWQHIGKKEEESPDVNIFIDPRDGQKYKYRNFGTTAGDWMLENMRAKTYAQGGTAPTLSATGTNTDKHYCYPAPDTAPDPLPGTATGAVDGTDTYYYELKPTMGLLYNWAAVINMGTGTGEYPDPGEVNQGETAGANPNLLLKGPQGICPNGWHVPSDKEWNDLEAEIANNPEKYSSNSGTSWSSSWATSQSWRNNVASGYGESLKAFCPLPSSKYPSTGGKSMNSSLGGFDVLLAGTASGPASDPEWHVVSYYGITGSFWTASASNAIGMAYVRSVNYNRSGVMRANSNRYLMYSVRCKKD